MTSRSYNTQHLAETLSEIGKIAYSESRAATVNTIIWQVNVLGISNPQFNAILQTHACQFKLTLLQHLRSDVHAYHVRAWTGSTNNGNRKIRGSCTQVEARFTCA